MKRTLIFLAILFTVTLGVVAGVRMNSEAMAVVIGVICGVAASVPTSLLIMYALNRRDAQQTNTRAASPYPPVVVVNPSAPQPSPWQRQQPPMLDGYSMQMPRQFKVIGEEETHYSSGEDLL